MSNPLHERVHRGVGMSGNPIIFDRPLLRARRRRARALGPETFLIDRVAADLAERLSAVLRQFDVAVDLGTPTDAVRAAFTGLTSIGTLIAVNPDVTGQDAPAVAADEEALPFRDSALDLAVSAVAVPFV